MIELLVVLVVLLGLYSALKPKKPATRLMPPNRRKRLRDKGDWPEQPEA